MRRNKYKKQYSWNPDIAYLTGLVAADGCLVNDGRHINITSKDEEIIRLAQNILDMDAKVAVKVGGYGSTALNLQFSNVAFYDFLVRCGLTPAKSKTIGPLLLPKVYYRDFLRGYFDGDGTVYGYWDKRWPNSLMYYTGYVSASPRFLEWLRAMNSNLTHATAGVVKPNIRAFTLTYAKADSRKLFKYMYYNDSLPMLTRKYQKFFAFLGADPYAYKEL